jgi:hypothetical protein
MQGIAIPIIVRTQGSVVLIAAPLEEASTWRASKPILTRRPDQPQQENRRRSGHTEVVRDAVAPRALPRPRTPTVALPASSPPPRRSATVGQSGPELPGRKTSARAPRRSDHEAFSPSPVRRTPSRPVRETTPRPSTPQVLAPAWRGPKGFSGARLVVLAWLMHTKHLRPEGVKDFLPIPRLIRRISRKSPIGLWFSTASPTVHVRNITKNVPPQGSIITVSARQRCRSHGHDR